MPHNSQYQFNLFRPESMIMVRSFEVLGIRVGVSDQVRRIEAISLMALRNLSIHPSSRTLACLLFALS
jgi:hypothetical protein